MTLLDQIILFAIENIHVISPSLHHVSYILIQNYCPPQIQRLKSIKFYIRSQKWRNNCGRYCPSESWNRRIKFKIERCWGKMCSTWSELICIFCSKNSLIWNFQDKYKRALADGENMRIRLTKQIEDAKIFCIQNFCKDLLEVRFCKYPFLKIGESIDTLKMADTFAL